MKPTVDEWMRSNTKWPKEMKALRAILKEVNLDEDLKWYTPCYSYDGRNIVLINRMKNYCAMAFFKGVLLNDSHGLLSSPGKNSQQVRMIKFTSLEEIQDQRSQILDYVREAIAIEKAGRKVVLKEISDYDVPEELQARLNADPQLKKAFDNLTPGRQRGYYMHIGQAKRTETRASRVEKCAPMIMAGKGLNDR